VDQHEDRLSAQDSDAAQPLVKGTAQNLILSRDCSYLSDVRNIARSCFEFIVALCLANADYLHKQSPLYSFNAQFRIFDVADDIAFKIFAAPAGELGNFR
jgi:hypothetical protein